MNWEEAKKLAKIGIKVTHSYFSPSEYLIMHGNMIVFEDGVQIFEQEWFKEKDYLLNNWSIYENN